MDINEENELEIDCPQCGSHKWGGYECDICGFADNLLDCEYETPSGNIVYCSQEIAFELGYITHCDCGSVITWWEKEDIGRCIECWHKNRKVVDN